MNITLNNGIKIVSIATGTSREEPKVLQEVASRGLPSGNTKVPGRILRQQNLHFDLTAAPQVAGISEVWLLTEALCKYQR